MATPVLLRVAFWVGLAGFVLGLAAHLATVTGYPPPGVAVGLRVGAIVALAPVVFALKA